MQDDGSASKARVALSSGIASAKFERDVRDAMDARLRETIAEPPVPADATPLSNGTEAVLPLYRRVFRRLLRSVRPLAMPFMHRFQLRVAHAVGTSPAIQEQILFLSEIRAELREARSEIASALDIRPGVDSIASRLAMLEERLVGLQSLAVANLNALTDRTGSDFALDADVDLIDEVRALRHRQDIQNQRIDQLLKLRHVSLGDEVLIRTSFGWLIVPAEDRPLLAAMAEHGDALEPGTVQVMRAILSPGDVAVDVGANVGAILVAMASVIGVSGRLVAIEPTPRCVEALYKTLAINGLAARCRIMPFAAGARAAKATLHVGATHSHNSLLPLPFEAGTAEVEVETLDNLVPEDHIPSLIKIDVEGAELEVLAGMSRILERSPNVALVVELGASHLDRGGVSLDQWIGAFAAAGFQPWSIDEVSGQLSAFSSAGLQEVPSVNLLMLRDDPSRWPALQVLR